MRPTIHRARLFALASLLVAFSSLCSGQSFSFVGLAWGDPYETVNQKLVAAGFSKMLELVIQQSEPANAAKVRLFEGGQLLRQPARGAAFFANNRLIGIKVDIKAEPKGLESLYDNVLSILKSRYGRPNIGFTNLQSEWGSSDLESLTLSTVPKDNEVVALYKSREWKTIDQDGKKRESAKF